MIGIYKIYCKIDSKVYIGYSSNITRRFASHKTRLRNNTHDNKYLQRAWNKHGENAFSFVIIEECELTSCIEREHYHVKQHNAHHRKFGYNLALTGVGNIGKMPAHIIEKSIRVKKERAAERGFWLKPETIKKQADSRRGFKHTEEAKMKIKKASIGRKKSKEVIQKTVDAHNLAVEQYSLDNEYIRTFKSIVEALSFLNIYLKSGHISQCCKNKRKTAYGYKWKYKNQTN